MNPVHDTVLNAAYLCRVLSEGGDYVDSLSYWTFSDVFEECDIPRSQFHGGFGLIALNGIPKPTFYVFMFFKRMEGNMLFRDEKTLVTRKEDGAIAVLAWNDVMEKGEGFKRELTIEIPVTYASAFTGLHQGGVLKKSEWDHSENAKRLGRTGTLNRIRLYALPVSVSCLSSTGVIPNTLLYT